MGKRNIRGRRSQELLGRVLRHFRNLAPTHRLFRKAGVFLAQARFDQALVTLREGEAFALALGDAEKLALFREEIVACEQRRGAAH